jgi:hypothetical protein
MTTKLEALVAELDAVRQETLALLREVPDEAFSERRGDEWSPAELLEHLVLSEASVGRVIKKVLRETEGALPPYPADDSHLAVRVEAAFEGMESPDVVRPEGGLSREALLARGEDIRGATRELLLGPLSKVDPSAGQFQHPRFGSLDLYEWPAVVVAAHERAHQGQLRRIVRAAPE